MEGREGEWNSESGGGLEGEMRGMEGERKERGEKLVMGEERGGGVSE